MADIAGFRPVKIWQIICKILEQKTAIFSPQEYLSIDHFFQKKSSAVTVSVN